jgi:phosphonate transport system substrate-binding protein
MRLDAEAVATLRRDQSDVRHAHHAPRRAKQRLVVAKEDVWLAQPSNAERTKVLARLDDLPTPPFIVRADMDETLVDQLKQTLLGLTGHSKDALYAGFTEFQDARMQRWFADLAALPGLAHAA